MKVDYIVRHIDEKLWHEGRQIIIRKEESIAGKPWLLLKLDGLTYSGHYLAWIVGSSDSETIDSMLSETTAIKQYSKYKLVEPYLTDTKHISKNEFLYHLKGIGIWEQKHMANVIKHLQSDLPNKPELSKPMKAHYNVLHRPNFSTIMDKKTALNILAMRGKSILSDPNKSEFFLYTDPFTLDFGILVSWLERGIVNDKSKKSNYRHIERYKEQRIPLNKITSSYANALMESYLYWQDSLYFKKLYDEKYEQLLEEYNKHLPKFKLELIKYHEKLSNAVSYVTRPGYEMGLFEHNGRVCMKSLTGKIQPVWFYNTTVIKRLSVAYANKIIEKL